VTGENLQQILDLTHDTGTDTPKTIKNGVINDGHISWSVGRRKSVYWCACHTDTV